MERLTVNQALAFEVIGRLRAAGTRTFCVCPGGRNAPLVEAIESLAGHGADVLGFFEERSAGFFALGRARRDGAPVVVTTTSGTAAAELLPAMVEAHYSCVPLVAVTADRPRACRGTGAPQSIEQVGLFGSYARYCVDVDRPGGQWPVPRVAGPCHVNVCFDELLLDGWCDVAVPVAEAGPVPPAPGGGIGATVGRGDAGPYDPADRDRDAQVLGFLDRVRAPLVIVGALDALADRERVSAFCRALGAPVLAEAASGVGPGVGDCLLGAGEAVVGWGFERRMFDSVVRLGDVPSFRVWRALDSTLRVPVLSVSRKPWPGLTRGTHIEVPPAVPLPLDGTTPARCGVLARSRRPGAGELFERDRRVADAIDRLVARYPGSEPAIVRRLSGEVPAGARVYLGNSLPIREWNQFAIAGDRGLELGASRGANGIDGQVSAFLGWARPGAENWAVLGDLTALYDLPALWALRHLDGVRLRIVVVNNGGGRIFERMFRNERFQNRHGIGFRAWADLWNADYCEGWPGREMAAAALIELRPDPRETAAFHAALAAETRE